MRYNKKCKPIIFIFIFEGYNSITFTAVFNLKFLRIFEKFVQNIDYPCFFTHPIYK